MRTRIAKIVRIERWETAGKQHCRTHILTDEGDEVAGYGDHWQVGDRIIAFFNDSRNRAQFVADKQIVIDNTKDK